MTTMPFVTFLERCIVALLDNAAIKEFCLGQYGRLPSLRYGRDPFTWPEETDLPALCLTITDQSWDNTSASRMTVEMELGAAVQDAGCQTLAGDIPVKVGLVHAEALRVLCVTALMQGGLGKVQAGGGVEQEIMDPLYASYSFITATY